MFPVIADSGPIPTKTAPHDDDCHAFGAISAGPIPERAIAALGTALYVRVSSEEQDLAGQERDLRIYAQSKGWEVVKVYLEKVSARGLVLRDQYEQLLKDARNPDRGWNHLLTWSLDRWSREDKFTRAIATIEDIEAQGIKFHSMREPLIDSSEDGTPNMGRDLLRAILPVIAAFESRRKAERVKVAMREIKEGRRATRSGRPPGRPVRVTPEKEQAILRFRAQGLAWKAIAVRVGLPEGTCSSVGWKARHRALSTPSL
jgi:DNA invertase Pin-like site-specific DNA recombinase